MTHFRSSPANRNPIKALHHINGLALMMHAPTDYEKYLGRMGWESVQNWARHQLAERVDEAWKMEEVEESEDDVEGCMCMACWEGAL